MAEQVYYTDEEMHKVEVELENYKQRYKEEQEENKRLKQILKDIARLNIF